MVFNSVAFLWFFVVVYSVYLCLDWRRQNLLLLVASYVFYGWWNWRFLGLLWLTTVIDYTAARQISRAEGTGRRRAWLLVSISSNLIVLGVFKYFDFFVSSFAALLSRLGLSVNPPVLNVIIPVGISFYTFQSISYVVDVYRGSLRARPIFEFALFVSYFPHLVAGPIVRPTLLLPQFERDRRGNIDLLVGAKLIVLGLFQKLVLSDTISASIGAVFATPHLFSGTEVLAAVLLYSLQIYGDFAGYSNIARGVSKLMGIDLSVNFRTPYLARSITEFWRRWHISLSTWLRDYLYIPLGGNRHGPWRTYANLMITMLLGGLWHGARWTFVAWGGLHGLWLVVHRRWSEARGASASTASSVWRQVAGAGWIALTFSLVSFSWVFFRAPTFATAGEIFARIASGTGQLSALRQAVVYYLLCAVMSEWPERRNQLGAPAASRIEAPVYALMLFFVVTARYPKAAPFIYFQF